MYRLVRVNLDLQEIHSSSAEKFHHHHRVNQKTHVYLHLVVPTVNAEMLIIKVFVLVYLILMELHQIADQNV